PLPRLARRHLPTLATGDVDDPELVRLLLQVWLDDGHSRVVGGKDRLVVQIARSDDADLIALTIEQRERPRLGLHDFSNDPGALGRVTRELRVAGGGDQQARPGGGGRWRH